MPYQPINPADLDGEELDAWYRRSPDEIEAARQTAAQQAYDAFFNAPPWAGNGGDGLSPADSLSSGPTSTVPTVTPDSLDKTGAGRDDGANLELIGNPHNPRLRREWEQKYGQAWPKNPETGRPYDVAHNKAIADGGTNTVDNIRPMHPADHLAEHLANGDYARWARRQWIARTFGGRVAPSLGPLSVFSDVLGMLSGRIRTNSFDNFSSDMMGWPSQEDQMQQIIREQKALDPNWKPGDAPLI